MAPEERELIRRRWRGRLVGADGRFVAIVVERLVDAVLAEIGARCGVFMTDMNQASVTLSRKIVYDKEKLEIHVTFTTTLVNFGTLKVMLSGPDTLLAEDFVKSYTDSTTYIGFVTINEVQRGHYEVESIVHYALTAPSNPEVVTLRKPIGIDL